MNLSFSKPKKSDFPSLFCLLLQLIDVHICGADCGGKYVRIFLQLENMLYQNYTHQEQLKICETLWHCSVTEIKRHNSSCRIFLWVILLNRCIKYIFTPRKLLSVILSNFFKMFFRGATWCIIIRCVTKIKPVLICHHNAIAGLKLWLSIITHQ